MNDIRVSIIIPIYNVGAYLDKCIKSVIEQSLRQIEIILIDDGSTDGSGDICDSFAKNDNRITVIHQRNKGLVSARKMGISVAKGEYVGFVDGDDYVDEEMFESLSTCLEETDADFVHSGYFIKDKYLGPDEERTFRINDDNRYEYLEELTSWHLQKLKGMTPSIWSKLFKREIIIDAYSTVPDEASFGEDILCLLKCVMIAKKMAFLNKAFYHYNVRMISLSHDPQVRNSTKKTLCLSDNMERLLRNEGCYDRLMQGINEFVYRSMYSVIQQRVGRTNIQQYYFSDIDMLKKKKVVLYGAGAVGADYYTQISRYKECNIVAWVDRDYTKCKYEFREVLGVETLNTLDFDLIVVAQAKKSTAESIIEFLKGIGIDEGRIIWERPKSITENY